MFNKLKLFALLTVGCGSLVADSYDPSHGQWRVTGEYLYLLPTFDDSSFVIESPVSTAFPNGSHKNNNFNFRSGFRVGGAYTFCDCNRELQVYYTNLNASQNKTVAGDFLWATIGRPDFTSNFENYAGTATSHLKLLYQTVDAFYAQQITSSCGLDFSALLGIEAAEIKLHEDYTYVSADDTGVVHNHARIEGIGPQLGFGLNYDVFENRGCNCPGKLSLNVFASSSLLATKSKTSAENVLNDVIDLDVSDSSSWRVVPALHARVGLNYETQFACVDTSLEIGYEFSSYFRALSRLGFPDDTADGLAFKNYYNFDVQGLYVALSARF